MDALAPLATLHRRPWHEPGDRVPPRGETAFFSVILVATVVGLIARAGASIDWPLVVMLSALCLIGEMLAVSFGEGLSVTANDMFLVIAVVSAGWQDAVIVGAVLLAYIAVWDARSVEQMIVKSSFLTAPLLSMLLAASAMAEVGGMSAYVAPVATVAVVVLAQAATTAILMFVVGAMAKDGPVLRSGGRFVASMMSTFPTDVLSQVPMATLGVIAWQLSPVYSAFLIAPFLVSWLSLHKAAQLEHARRQIGTDALTGIDNRGRFNERVEEEVELAHRYGHDFAVILGDLDDFKKINDTLGHQVGDEVLIAVASTLDEVGRSNGASVARFGGEEFVLTVPVKEAQDVLRLAVSCKDAVAEACAEWSATISLGVAYLEADSSVQSLVERADKALYAAKYAGKDRVYHQPSDAIEPFDGRLTLAGPTGDAVDAA